MHTNVSKRERENLDGVNSCRFEVYFVLVLIFWFTKVTFMLCESCCKSLIFLPVRLLWLLLL